MKRGSLFVLACFLGLAHVAHAQSAIEFIAKSNVLPMRNLLMEVRQLQSSNSQRSTLESAGAVGMGSDGSLVLQGQVQARNQQLQQSGTALQQVLVLNGRSANVALRSTQPLRVLQSFVRQGRLVVTQGVVFLEAGTGFLATPRWDGSEQLELSIAAQQALPASANTAGLPSSASMQSVIMVPLDQWTTIAQTDLAAQSEGQASGAGGSSNRQDITEVQVRITVR